MSAEPKNILFDICHPAHYHLFKHVIHRLKEAGQTVIIAARDKDVTVELFRDSGFEFQVLSRQSKTRAGMPVELVQRDFGILRLMRRYKVQLAVGTSVSISHASRLCGARAIIFNEDDADYIPLFAVLAYPWAHAICTPEGVRAGRWARKQVTYRGYHELAYLHPDVFTPDHDIRDKLGLKSCEQYSIVRLSALRAHHDTGEKGLSETQVRSLTALLQKHGIVFISAEGSLPEWATQYRLPTPPNKIHDVLANAKCLVSDSQTMTMEAAALGVPAFRCNSFVGRCSVIEEMTTRYEMAYGFRPVQFEGLLEKLDEILGRNRVKEEWQEKRGRMLSEKINVSDWMFDFLQSF